MPRRKGHREGTCRTCEHAEQPRIDFLLVNGAGIRSLASRYGFTPSSLHRHFHDHISEHYKKVMGGSRLKKLEEKCLEGDAEMLDYLDLLIRGHVQQWAVAFESGASLAMVQHTNKLLGLVELRSKITRELPAQSLTTNITNNIALFDHPDYLRAMTALTEALKPHPTARKDVAAALRSLGPAAPPMIEHQAA